jgi:hypothetical protein
LPLPKTEKRQTWAIPAAASTFANLAKRKPLSATPVVSSKKSAEELVDSSSKFSLGTSSLLPPAQIHDEERRAGMEDGEDIFREMRRRKSSAGSEVAPPLPKRRQRQPSLTHQRRASQYQTVGNEGGEGLLVVEASVGESAEASPTKESGDGIT